MNLNFVKLDFFTRTKAALHWKIRSLTKIVFSYMFVSRFFWIIWRSHHFFSVVKRCCLTLKDLIFCLSVTRCTMRFVIDMFFNFFAFMFLYVHMSRRYFNFHVSSNIALLNVMFFFSIHVFRSFENWLTSIFRFLIRRWIKKNFDV